ncbi:MULTISPECIES: hypothetical protein [Nostocales]|nr:MULTISPECIES: hypothetical protein [Nostocales]
MLPELASIIILSYVRSPWLKTIDGERRSHYIVFVIGAIAF